jgi:hypothetical protein
MTNPNISPCPMPHCQASEWHITVRPATGHPETRSQKSRIEHGFLVLQAAFSQSVCSRDEGKEIKNLLQCMPNT